MPDNRFILGNNCYFDVYSFEPLHRITRIMMDSRDYEIIFAYYDYDEVKILLLELKKYREENNINLQKILIRLARV